MPLPTPQFEVVSRSEAQQRRKPRRERRDWKPIVDALVAGRDIFMSDEELTDSNVKYLMLCLYRRGKGERLRTQRTVRKGDEGRMLWVDYDERPKVDELSAEAINSHRPEDGVDLVKRGL